MEECTLGKQMDSGGVNMYDYTVKTIDKCYILLEEIYKEKAKKALEEEEKNKKEKQDRKTPQRIYFINLFIYYFADQK